MYWKKIFCLLFFMPVMVFATILVKDSKPAAVIVLADNAGAPAQLGAYELQYHIQKMTGAKLPIVTKLTSGIKTKIFIGDSPLARKAGLKKINFKFQEYLVKVSGGNIFLLGCDLSKKQKVDYQKPETFPGIWEKIGTLYAVYDFLEKLGFRWYLPTELGTTFKPCRELSIGDMDICRVPSLEMRKMYENNPYRLPADLCGDTIAHKNTAMLNPRDTMLWYLRSRVGGRFEIINHSLGTIQERFPDKHKWFAQGYEKDPFMQLCFTNPEVIAQVAQDARDFFDGKIAGNKVMGHATPNYKSDIFTVFPMDNGSYCQCKKCKQYYTHTPKRGKGTFSNDRSSEFFFRFVNAVAKEVKKTHPNKLIATGAYSSFAYPPKTFKLEDNIMIMVCLHVRTPYSKKVTENDECILRAWHRDYPNMKKYVWLYYCFPTTAAKRVKGRCLPGFFGSRVGNYFKYFNDCNVSGMFWEPAALANNQKSVLFDQVEGYINWKLAWDRTLDPKKLFDEFFKTYYGPAEKPMKDFYTLAESIFCDPANYPSHAGSAWSFYSVARLVSKANMKKLGNFIEQAKKLNPPEPYMSRIKLFERGVWQYIVKGRAMESRNRSTLKCMQQAPVPFLKNPEPGNPLKIDWKKACALNMYGDLRTKRLNRSISVRVAHDRTWLYFRYLENIKTETLKKDGASPYQNDEWETFFGKQRTVPYSQFGVDAKGNTAAVKRTGPGFEKRVFNGKIHVKMFPNQWTTYIAVKMDDIVEGGIKPGEILYYNLIRSAANYKPVACWVPTFGGYHAPERFGELYLVPER